MTSSLLCRYKGPRPALGLPPATSGACARFLATDEEQAFRKIVEARYLSHLPEFDLAINTGLRLSEQYGLSWEYVDMQRRVLTIPLSKNGQSRYVPLNDAAMQALEAVRNVGNGQRWVFLNRFGERLLSPRKWFDAAVKEICLQSFTWHCLRHTFASRLVMAGV